MADEKIRAELLRLRALPPWGRVQNDEWDRLSRFVYHVRSLGVLRRETKRVAAEAGLPLNDFARYVVHRWYNYHTHQVVLDILCAHPRVRREPNPRHHTVDLYLDGEPFDLKLTRFPRSYRSGLPHALDHPEDLARWLYVHQSREGRHHGANRLFVVFHHAEEPERTWELRRDFDLLEQVIGAFLGAPRLFRISFTAPDRKRYSPRAGVIFCVRGAGPQRINPRRRAR